VKRILCSAILLLVLPVSVSAGEWDVLPDRLEGGIAKQDMVKAYLSRLSHQAFDRRQEDYEKLKTEEQIQQRQKRLREFFFKHLGSLPEKTPLNARVVKVLQRDGYRIEKIIFESRPKFYVTANLYLPDSKTPVPGVLIGTGHTPESKASEMNQRICLLLVKNGIAAPL